jgi:hypothetical protein
MFCLIAWNSRCHGRCELRHVSTSGREERSGRHALGLAGGLSGQFRHSRSSATTDYQTSGEGRLCGGDDEETDRSEGNGSEVQSDGHCASVVEGESSGI